MNRAPHSPVAANPTAENQPTCRREDLAYQVTTIGAIVTVLISLWVF